MLPTQAIEPRTLLLLKELQSLQELVDFYLVGGTALAMRYGHRLSVDLDLFCIDKPDFPSLKSTLENHFGSGFLFEGQLMRVGLFCYIRGIKVDIVWHPHPIISPPIEIEGVRLYDDSDLAAMKVNAILGRGRKKDFWDIAVLLNKYSLDQIITWHRQKFPSQMLLISVPDALTYFADAEDSEAPVSLKGQTWAGVKKTISKAVRDYLK